MSPRSQGSRSRVDAGSVRIDVAAGEAWPSVRPCKSARPTGQRLQGETRCAETTPRSCVSERRDVHEHGRLRRRRERPRQLGPSPGRKRTDRDLGTVKHAELFDIVRRRFGRDTATVRAEVLEQWSATTRCCGLTAESMIFDWLDRVRARPEIDEQLRGVRGGKSTAHLEDSHTAQVPGSAHSTERVAGTQPQLTAPGHRGAWPRGPSVARSLPDPIDPGGKCRHDTCTRACTGCERERSGEALQRPIGTEPPIPCGRRGA